MTKWLEAKAATAQQGQPPKEYLTEKIRLTSAQILAAETTPVVILPAPGPGKKIVPIRAIIDGEGGTPYVNTGNVFVDFESAPTNGIFNGLASVLDSADPISVLSVVDGQANLAENEALVFQGTGLGTTTGDFDVTIQIEYEIIES